MEALYFETNRKIQETQNYFQQLNNIHTDTSEAESSILRNIAVVNAYVVLINHTFFDKNFIKCSDFLLILF